MHNPGPLKKSSEVADHYQVLELGRKCRMDVRGFFCYPPLVDDPVSFIADHYHTVVRVQVDSTKLVHAGLLCVESVGLHPDSTTAVLMERRQAGYMIIVRHEVACRSCAHGNGGYHPCHRVNLVLLCHKCNLTSPQHGHRGSLLVIARAMSTRSVEIESGTWRCTRPAAARDVTSRPEVGRQDFSEGSWSPARGSTHTGRPAERSP